MKLADQVHRIIQDIVLMYFAPLASAVKATIATYAQDGRMRHAASTQNIANGDLPFDTKLTQSIPPGCS